MTDRMLVDPWQNGDVWNVTHAWRPNAWPTSLHIRLRQSFIQQLPTQIRAFRQDIRRVGGTGQILHVSQVASVAVCASGRDDDAGHSRQGVFDELPRSAAGLGVEFGRVDATQSQTGLPTTSTGSW